METSSNRVRAVMLLVTVSLSLLHNQQIIVLLAFLG
jgi:hypothetical protein